MCVLFLGQVRLFMWHVSGSVHAVGNLDSLTGFCVSSCMWIWRRMSPSPCLCLCSDKKCSFSVGREKKQCSYFFHCYSRVFAASRAALDHFVLGKHTYRNISTGCAVKYFILCVAHFLALSVCVCLMSARLYSHYRLPCCLCHTDCKSSAAER